MQIGSNVADGLSSTVSEVVSKFGEAGTKLVSQIDG